MIYIKRLVLFLGLASTFLLNSMDESSKMLIEGINKINQKEYEEATKYLISCFQNEKSSILKAYSAKLIKTLYKKNKIKDENLKNKVKEIIKKDKKIKYSILDNK